MIPVSSLALTDADIRTLLLDFEQPCYVVRDNGQLGFSQRPTPHAIASLPPLPLTALGDPGFQQTYRVKYGYMAGAMANGIASAEMVTALGRAGILASFGAAGLVPEQTRQAIQTIQAALPQGVYAFNLIHSPSEESIEQRTVELYLQHQISVVEASAFLGLTPHLVRYRVAGLELAGSHIQIKNRVIAKVSRTEVARQFMQPAPEKMLAYLLQQGWITAQQAQLAQYVPLADDITVEADSGGHTDNRPLVSLLPVILALRDEIQAHHQYPVPIRIGAAGGIGTPEAALAAFAMGAAYIVTGSVNQACVEAGASPHTKKLLAQAEMADVMMAPAADMFEMGVKVQLLKRGTMFPVRAQKIYKLYEQYPSLEALPAEERDWLEKHILKRSLEATWQDTARYFMQRDPGQVERAEQDPKRKMALVFRWYLGLSSRWSNTGESGRELDYQIWCGPAMGAFNAWVKGSYLENPAKRQVVDIAEHLMRGAAYQQRIHSLRLQQISLPAGLARYQPTQR